LNLDGLARAKISTGIPFLDTCWTLVARHGAMDLQLTARATSTWTSTTRSKIRQSFSERQSRKRSGSKRGGILRAGILPDADGRTLAAAAIGLQRRPHLVCKWKFSAKIRCGLQTELLEDFFGGFAQALERTLHLRLLYGRSSHHQVEAIFKAFARALRFAATRDPQLKRFSQTKGVMNIALVEYGAGNLSSVERRPHAPRRRIRAARPTGRALRRATL